MLEEVIELFTLLDVLQLVHVPIEELLTKLQSSYMTETESLSREGGEESSKASNEQLFTPEPTPELTSEPVDDAGGDRAGGGRAGGEAGGGRAGGATGDNPIGGATSSLTKARRTTKIGNVSKHVTAVSKQSAIELADYVLDCY